MMAEVLGDAQGSAVMAVLRGKISCPGRDAARSGAAPGAREWSYISSRPSSNGFSPPARFFFFDRCHTTPGKPFSGTKGSPV
ncbi:hypothetical protein ACVIIV_002436 [Bradyrhizobium sp. USDA 4354]